MKLPGRNQLSSWVIGGGVLVAGWAAAKWMDPAQAEMFMDFATIIAPTVIGLTTLPSMAIKLRNGNGKPHPPDAA